MFVVNEDNSIYATRGDIVFFSVTAQENGKAYTFQPGDVVRITVYGKKNAENVVLQKDFPVFEATESVAIYLSEQDTKFGDVISKPTDYWYEVELNPFTDPQTIIGYDEEGPRVFRLFPEGADIPPFVPDPEDIPVVDTELDMTSTRPVQNQAIARAVERIKAAVVGVPQYVTPQKFGAMGDGVTDDTTALQAAITYAEENTGLLYIPSGDYRITGTLRIRKSLRIVGDKGCINYKGTYLRHYGDGDISAIYVGSEDGSFVHNVFIENIALGNFSVDFLNQYAEEKTGITFANASEIEVENCSVYGFHIGVCMSGLSIANFNKCWFYYNKYGIWTADANVRGEKLTRNRMVSFYDANVYRNDVGVMLGCEQLFFYSCHMENQSKAVMLFDNNYGSESRFLQIDKCNIVNQISGVPFILIAPTKVDTASYIKHATITNTQLQLTDAEYCISQEKTVPNEGYIFTIGNVFCMGVKTAVFGGVGAFVIAYTDGYVNAVANFDGTGAVKPFASNNVKVLGTTFEQVGRTVINGVVGFNGKDQVAAHEAGDMWLANGVVRINDGTNNTYFHIHKWSENTNLPAATFEGQMVYDATFNYPRWWNHRTERWMDSLPRSASAPTTGRWAYGDIVFNSTPVGGGAIGWVCVEAGTPGEWRSFGTVATE